MAIREVIEIGHPLLREQARSLEAGRTGTDELGALVTDMIDTMHATSGIGIAAPQIAVSLRAAVIEIDVNSERYPNMPSFPLTVFLNPRVTVLDETTFTRLLD